MTQHLGVIGFPLGHTLSPVFQQAALDHYGLDIRYEAWPTPPDQVPGVVASLRGDDRLGCNVTVPHKQAVIALLDSLDAVAQAIGAVNTIMKEEGRLVGINTDCSGFLRGLHAESQFRPRDSRVVVLGAGGAARAVVYALLQARAGEVTIVARDQGRAAALAGSFVTLAAERKALVNIQPWEQAGLADALETTDLLVNCTPIGMLHSAAKGQSPLEGLDIKPASTVYDLVYNPEETPLLRQARKAGCPVVGGLAMLVYQGAEAFEYWLNRDAPIEVMFAAARKVLAAG